MYMKVCLYAVALAVSLLSSASLWAQMPGESCQSLAAEAKAGCLLSEVDGYIEQKNFEAATPLCFEALAIAERQQLPALSYRANLVAASLSEAKGDHTNAMRQYLEALRLASDAQNANWIIDAKIGVAKVFAVRENYDQAKSNLSEALVLAKAENLWDAAADVHARLGQVALEEGIMGEAQLNLRSALDLYIEQEAFAEAAQVSGTLADQYLQTGDYDNAELFADQTLELHTSAQDVLAVAHDNVRLGKVYAGFGDYEGALEMTETALGIFSKTGDAVGKAGALRDFATYHAKTGNRAAASAYAAQAMEAMSQVTGGIGYDVPRDVAALLERQGDLAGALAAQRDYLRRREAYFDGEKSRALVELTTRFESEFATEQQNRKIAELETQEAYAKTRFMLLLGLAGLIAALAFSLFMNVRRKQRDNALLITKNEEIQRQKAEIDLKNLELADKNQNLNRLNAKLVDEMAERESIQKTSFARDRFLATMSHEMRTPINIISGLCHLLLEETPRPDQTEHLRTLQFSANNLVVFINDILDFSKIEAGKLNLEKREFNPKRLFDEVAARFEMAARTTQVRPTYDFDPAIPACLLGDPARFNQIMTNLVTTSFAHSVNANVHVSAKVEEMRKDDVLLRFQIEDEGQVMDEKQLESMFRSFTFNPDDVFEGYNSSDLVLAITRRLVDLQNGHIEVKPREQGGNRFTVLLSFKIVSKADQIKRTGIARSFEHLAGHQVLLVEDNKINQLVVLKMLTRLGIDVTTADNGVEALEILNHRSFDLVLMDIQMPKMDGYRATAEIRKHINPDVREVPVIALTASAFLSEREKAKLFGMNDHVGKPFAPEELLDKMSTCLVTHLETFGARASFATSAQNIVDANPGSEAKAPLSTRESN